MANCGLLLNDGSSFILLNDGTSVILLNDSTCAFEPGQGEEAEAPAVPAPTPTPDRGFDRYMEEFARQRMLERQARENEEIMRIAAFEEEFLLNFLKRLM